MVSKVICSSHKVYDSLCLGATTLKGHAPPPPPQLLTLFLFRLTRKTTPWWGWELGAGSLSVQAPVKDK